MNTYEIEFRTFPKDENENEKKGIWILPSFVLLVAVEIVIANFN